MTTTAKADKVKKVESVPLSAYDEDEMLDAASVEDDADDDVSDDEAADDADEERSAAQREAAVEVIRRFRGDTRLTLTYVRTSPNPYRDDDADIIEIYADDRGFEYWIDPQGDVLVQAGPSARVHPTPRKTRDADRRSVGELRSAALALICALVDGFADKRSSYHPLEDNRHRETYYLCHSENATGRTREPSGPPASRSQISIHSIPQVEYTRK